MSGADSKPAVWITPATGVHLQGDSMAVARQFRDLVVHPLVKAIDRDGGRSEAVGFLACLLTQCMADIRVSEGEQGLKVLVDTALAALAAVDSGQQMAAPAAH